MIGRYGKRNIKISPDYAKVSKQSLRTALPILLGYKSCGMVNVKRFNNDLFMTHEELVVHQTNYIESLQKKINSKPNIVKELQEELDMAKESLGFFNKVQAKHKFEDGFDTSDKVGQGIAQTSKKLNCVYSVWSRAILERILYIAKKKKRSIIIATHGSDTEFNDQYTEKINAIPSSELHHKTWFCADYSEWDSRFRHIFVEIMGELLIAAGCPESVVEEYIQFRKQWVMTANNYRSAGTTKLYGEEKKFSGDPFTICENTLLNMMLTFSAFEFKDVALCLFKGDDSAILCSQAFERDNLPFTSRGIQKNILSITGHKIKVATHKAGEFAGYILTPYGLFPDALRSVVKHLGKDYRDKEHMNEARESLKARMSVIKTETQRQVGAHFCSQHYADIGLAINNEEVLMLLNFMHSASMHEYVFSKDIRKDKKYQDGALVKMLTRIYPL